MNGEFGEELVRALPHIRRYALSLARAPDVAEDLVQITVERAIRNAASFQPGTRLNAWLFRITRNAWIDMTRRAQTAGHGIDAHDHPDSLPHDPAPGLEARLMVKSVGAAMSDLPSEQRDVLMLICVEEMSYAEAAAVLGIPLGTVMSRLSRARTALAARLGIKD